MNWQEIIRKSIELDDTSCCEDARLALVLYFERYAELAGMYALREALLQIASDTLEEPCEELKESIRYFKELWGSDVLFEADKLQDIMDKWEKCEDELQESKINLEVKQ